MIFAYYQSTRNPENRVTASSHPRDRSSYVPEAQSKPVPSADSSGRPIRRSCERLIFDDLSQEESVKRRMKTNQDSLCSVVNQQHLN